MLIIIKRGNLSFCGTLLVYIVITNVDTINIRRMYYSHRCAEICTTSDLTLFSRFIPMFVIIKKSNLSFVVHFECI